MSVPTRHVRTRTGCWTCRFRKKKCDEARPACEQCSHLRLVCDGYDGQPVWMKDPEKAAEKKAEIKKQMVRRSRRRKKNQDPTKAQIPSQSRPNAPPANLNPPTPPPTTISTNDTGFSQHQEQISGISLPITICENDFPTRFSTSSPEESGPMDISSPFNMRGMHWAVSLASSRPQSHTLSPPTTCTMPSRESTRAPSVEGTIKEDHEEEVEEEYDSYDRLPDSADSSCDTEIARYGGTPRQAIPFNNLPILQIQTENPLDINLANLYLRSIFGVTYRALSDEQVDRYNSALIVPMFNDNKSFLHGCLSSTALHLTATNISEHQRKALVTEVYRHRQKSLKSLKHQVAHSKDENERIKIAATVCALISFEVFSRRTDWQVHVKAATDCVVLLNWCSQRPTHPGEWFIYSRILWLDILSSITTGKRPVFSTFYHDILFLPPESRNKVNELVEMTGCEDAVLYLISEITCLENWKFEALVSQTSPNIEMELVRRHALLDQELKLLTITDLKNRSPRSEYSYCNYNSVHTSPHADEMDSEGDFGDDLTDVDSNFDGEDDDGSYVDEDPSQEVNEVVDGIVRRNSNYTGSETPYNNHHLSPTSPTETDGGDVFVADGTNKLIENRSTFRKAVTEAFRIMARVYLHIVTFGFNPLHPDLQSLLQEMLAVIDYIPSLYMGYERSIISPLLIVGSLARRPQDQQIISARLKKTAHMAKYGNLGNVDKILTEIWSRDWTPDPRQPVPWRQIMKEKNWEYLMV
ncbi:hypothetical protein TWF481_001348 [Arthrobotrys musiformis]|uniref:Zn(2)-C6 fungal-type domain-containing protein n=1 Tax=Arthrobotrys musiformis TaxID=47236 RepID=A0AAV9WRD7_9PEZI